jgi:hypothetical protein
MEEISYRDQILAGSLELPGKDKFEQHLGEEVADLVNKLWGAIWHNFLNQEAAINSTAWYDKFKDPQIFNVVVMSLSKAGWVVSYSIPERNWAEIILNVDHVLSFVTEAELQHVRATYKFSQYRLRATVSKTADKVRLNGKTVKTGLVRNGFMKAGNTTFSYDLEMLSKYKTEIGLNLTKSMDKIRNDWPDMRADESAYDAISLDVMEYILEKPRKYTRGECVADSRGRAISSSLGKVANPISSKDFRALLVLPK